MDAGARGIKEYNEKFNSGLLDTGKEIQEGLHHHYLPFIVIIIEEYGDLMIQGGKKVETPIARVSQLGRGVGLHMILTTQRPSIRVVTGIIKANFPTRIALRSQSSIHSRTVMEAKGAEELIGRGDALYSNGSNVVRLQCAYVEDNEVDTVVKHIVSQHNNAKHYVLPIADDNICQSKGE
jgi:S-DNA-T family DNA segregation ATPase FtsK/SpoIIIE